MKASHALTGTLLGLALCSVAITPAKAEPTQAETQQSPQLISQLRGHEVYKGMEQMKPSDYIMGHIVGRSGNIVTVRLPDGTFFSTAMADDLGGGKTSFYEGSDVRVVQNENGTYTLLGFYHPMWTSVLEEKYGVKMAAEEQGSASQRMALLEEIGTTPLPGLGEMQPQSQPTAQYEAAPAPVPALW